MADTTQMYETFCLVASAALGGKPDNASPPADPSKAPQTPEALEAILKRTMG